MRGVKTLEDLIYLLFLFFIITRIIELGLGLIMHLLSLIHNLDSTFIMDSS